MKSTNRLKGLGKRFWAAEPPVPVSKDKRGKIRLNLGCGDKLLGEYINIDIAPARKGRKPDFISDVRELKLPDNFAHEILAVHVIEHFYYWEAEEVLNEWFRVLRPGGKLVLELPNLAAAAKSLLENPQAAASPGREGQRSMWVFYGDPAWRDPLMCHKWGYTPQSMLELLQKIGLSEVRQEPALFKMREPRDMRMVGIKPRKQLPN